MTPKQLENYYEKLAKQGKAEFKLIFKSAPEDKMFIALDPLAEVIITARNPETNEIIFKEIIQMSSKEYEAEITITVLTMRHVFKKILDVITRKKSPEPSNVTINVHPHEGWKQRYESNEFTLTAKLGRNRPVHIWMYNIITDRKITKRLKPPYSDGG